MIPDHTQEFNRLTNDQLNKLIYDLSAESRLKYETHRETERVGLSMRGIDAKASESLSEPDLARD